jgi:hypothetical protein
MIKGFSCAVDGDKITLSLGGQDGAVSVILSPDEARSAMKEIEAAIRDARTFQHEADAHAAHGGGT